MRSRFAQPILEARRRDPKAQGCEGIGLDLNPTARVSSGIGCKHPVLETKT